MESSHRIFMIVGNNLRAGHVALDTAQAEREKCQNTFKGEQRFDTHDE